MNPHSFQKRKLKPLKMDSPDKFKGFIHKLWDELYWANFYCDILIEASKLCRKHEKAANFSPDFGLILCKRITRQRACAAQAVLIWF
jgi:hypothetical protein